MPMLTWMAGALRHAGLPVREVDGWRGRGHGAMGDVLGCLIHHTAGPATGDFPSERVVVNGRTGLPGPLCNLGLTRSGTWVVVAAGQAWHAGTGAVSWCPANQGNSRLIGVEAESTGTTKPNGDWTAAQRTSYPRGVAALLKHLGLGSYRVIGHKEWAPRRKIDPAFWDMKAFRADVARWMTAPTQIPVEDDLTPDQARMLEEVYRELTLRLPNRRGPDGAVIDGGGSDTCLGYAANSDGFGYRIEQLLEQIASRPGIAPAGPVALTAADRQAIAQEVASLLATRLAP